MIYFFSVQLVKITSDINSAEEMLMSIFVVFHEIKAANA